jgi:dipeptidase E
MGETREERLREYLEENAAPVVGLREGAWLRREGDSLRLEGRNGARLFRRGEEPEELAPGTALDRLLAAATT